MFLIIRRVVQQVWTHEAFRVFEHVMSPSRKDINLGHCIIRRIRPLSAATPENLHGQSKTDSLPQASMEPPTGGPVLKVLGGSWRRSVWLNKGIAGVVVWFIGIQADILTPHKPCSTLTYPHHSPRIKSP